MTREELNNLSDAELDALLRKMPAISVRTSGSLGEVTPEDVARASEQLREAIRPTRTFTGPAADYTGLEPPSGQLGNPLTGVAPQFWPLVPSQREGGEPLRPSFEAAGGIIGSLAALPGAVAARNPTLPIAAGAMGTAAGTQAYDLMRDVGRSPVGQALGVRDYTSGLTSAQRLSAPFESAVEDAGWSTAAQALPAAAAGVRALRRGLMGVDAEQAELGRMLLGDAYMQGRPRARPLVSAGIADLGENRGRTATRTFVQMPYAGGPAYKNQARKLEDYERVSEQYMGLFGPDRTVPELGADLRRNVESAYGAFRQEAANRYNMARTVAAAAGDVIPTADIRNVSMQGLLRILQDAPTLTTGAPMAPVSAELRGRVVNFLEQLDALPPRIDVAGLDWLSTELNNLQNMARKEGLQYDIVDDVRRAARDALRSSPSGAARALVEADDFFTRGMSTFEQATGQQVARTDRNMFRLGVERPGLLRDEELYSIVRNAKSPQAIQQLEDMLAHGRSSRARADARALMGSLARRYVTEALASARSEGKAGQQRIDVNQLEANLRLNDPNSSEYQTLSRLLRSAGMDLNDLRRFAQITRAVYENELPDVSTYMARRVAIGGGLAGAIGGLEAAGAGGLGVTGALATLLSLRYINSLATRPSSLRALIRTYDSNMPVAAKRAAYIRILRGLSGEEDAAGKVSRSGAINVAPQGEVVLNGPPL